MTSYRILSPSFAALVIESGDIIVQSAPVLAWSIGQQFAELRDYCRARGWQVEPLIERHEPHWLEYRGSLYELRWQDGRITEILLHSEGEIIELSYRQLPEPLQRLL